MINTIIFDLGGVLININKDAAREEFAKLGLTQWTPELNEQTLLFETGKISELQFIESFQKYLPNASIEEIRVAWNAIIPTTPIPLYRLEFLQMLSNKYRLILLSNTDPMHIDRFQHCAGMSFYRDFYQCFDKIYFSHELGLKKPDIKIFKLVIDNLELSPKRTLFIDDTKENTDAAASLGLHVWNIQLDSEDVVDLYKKDLLE
ncbi:MAG: HAD family hydrolase [Flavobacterium sp.]